MSDLTNPVPSDLRGERSSLVSRLCALAVCFHQSRWRWARRTVARFIRKALIGSLCLNDNEDICRNSGHRFRTTGPYSDIWKQISGDQNTRALTLAGRGVKPWGEEGFAG